MSFNRLRVLVPFIPKRNASRNAARCNTRLRTPLNPSSETPPEAVHVPESGDCIKEKPFPKKRVAMVLGYSGANYKGMQIQEDRIIKTIEGELFPALVKAGAVSTANSTSLNKISFSRASRTDKGVHAAVQLVSFKMIQGIDNVLTKINAELPDDICAFGVLPVPQSFNSRSSCVSRHYVYMLPTYALGASIEAIPIIPSDASRTFTEAPQYIPSRKELDGQRRYRASPETLERMRQILVCYVGEHNFHNFTKKQLSSDKSSNRRMLSIEITDPTVINGMEWVSIKIHGKSFMLHQIRKMIGLMVLMIRKNVSISLVNWAYESNRFLIPTAPSNGLFLDKPVFAGFNMKLNTLGRTPITFDAFEDKIHAFKEKHIYPSIIQEETSNIRWGKYIWNAEVYGESDAITNWKSPETLSEECRI